ncbi:MAG: phosphoribosylanthranilate isomerase [Phycisphaeraceae bacterium]|nr:phosphoribosylanthranilate isomerase [Phycisphaeraceae bacterium]
MARTRIKICGIRDEIGLQAAVSAGADAVGFVFVPGSPRYVEPVEAWALVSALPPFVTSVGVFCDIDVDEFCEIEEVCPTGLSQLQGMEPEHVVQACGPGVLKTVRYDARTIDAELTRWSRVDEVDAIVVEVFQGEHGEADGWRGLRLALDRLALNKPIVLAGGLDAGNVAEAIRIVYPYGVEVSIGSEDETASTASELIEAFCAAVRKVDAG